MWGHWAVCPGKRCWNPALPFSLLRTIRYKQLPLSCASVVVHCAVTGPNNHRSKCLKLWAAQTFFFIRLTILHMFLPATEDCLTTTNKNVTNMSDGRLVSVPIYGVEDNFDIGITYQWPTVFIIYHMNLPNFSSIKIWKWVGKMAQWTKILATPAWQPALHPGAHIKVEGESWFHKVVLWLPHPSVVWNILPHTTYLPNLFEKNDHQS